ncbi:RlmE family RNA methyltransferase [Lampropedia aestuarii]|uniref:Ribosomal RNA large subunit methyltransferase E n=1 Tax=Lampropedia aestuarii TaxID=2562762 RepID=A0A4S5BRC8_9BURK|nr:RlmE family RNA methyltransferase [Lampropedia aestuarii]MDH5857121.1 RlmE family RNA methyltransferase [Lampropedia aestuarii]THJ32266.1 RlmE family RNA methyltransferase [Lampropedia aestuarii]
MATKGKGSKVNKTWLYDHLNDPYVKLAQKEGYRARAVYKLKEIDEEHRLLNKAQVVVDLGCAPGAWCQYLSRKLNLGHGMEASPTAPVVVGVDLLPMEPVPGIHFIQGDFEDAAVLAQLEQAIGGRAVDAVVSDMAPNLSGHSATDGARIENLIEMAVDFAQNHLKPDGVMVAKVFHGPGYDNLVALFRDTFKHSKPYKPKASRSRSSEVFLIGQGLRR